MIEPLVEMICCKKGGASKKEIIAILYQFNFNKKDIDRLFSRLHYARLKSDSYSVILLNEQQKWYTFDNREYCTNVFYKLKQNKEKPNEKPAGIPFWMYDNYELCYSLFSNYYD